MRVADQSFSSIFHLQPTESRGQRGREVRWRRWTTTIAFEVCRWLLAVSLLVGAAVGGGINHSCDQNENRSFCSCFPSFRLLFAREGAFLGEMFHVYPRVGFVISLSLPLISPNPTEQQAIHHEDIRSLPTSIGQYCNRLLDSQE